MSNKQLEVFVRVVQLGSVTATAQALGMSQPSVSKSLALTEQHLGFTLFERSGGKMKPTAEASQVFEEALRMQEGIARFDRFLENVQRYRVGQLRVCATPALAINVLPLLAPVLRQAFPDLGLVLDMYLNNEIEAAIERQQYDLGFLLQPVDPQAPPPGVVCQGQMVCVMNAAHPLAGRAAIGWDDLPPRELIYITTDPRIVAMMASAIAGFRERPVSSLETNRYSMAINLVRQGLGVTVVDEFSLAGIDTTGLAIKPFAPALPIAVVAASAVRSAVAEPAERCIEALRGVLQPRG
ncbi:LysR substrate-binding domain-containing protein [Pseudomonas sp. NPDC007930]|uniref:LysR family transcriptional regulator n=1 Tax=Pseudomonas sp. NPDC007930 TaxID=3364417 RepID=UPI0036EACDB1